MSIAFLNSIPDRSGKPIFKRADCIRFLGISRIEDMHKNVKNTPRWDLSQEPAPNSPSQRQNNFKAFVDLDLSLKNIMISRKPKAIELQKWLTRKSPIKDPSSQRRRSHIVVKKCRVKLEQKISRLLIYNNSMYHYWRMKMVWPSSQKMTRA